METSKGYSVTELLARLIACPSVSSSDRSENDEVFGEARLMELLKTLLDGWGAETSLQSVAQQRDNLLARFAGKDRTRTLMLEAHADTVPVTDMSIPPFEGEIRNGRMYGRGACDTKGSMAAMLCAIRRVLEEGQPPTDVVFVSTCDEEVGASGAQHLIASGFRADAAIVGEPTELSIVTAHKGIARWRITTRGVAAHGSTPELGVNAISLMQKIIAAIDGPVGDALAARTDPLLGAPTIRVGTIQGGTQFNVVPSFCHIDVDRRLISSETREQALRELRRELDALKAVTPDMEYEIEDLAYYPPLDEPRDAFLAKVVKEGCRRSGQTPAMTAVPYGTNAGFFKAAGIPCVVLGPGSARQAHTMDEFIEIAQVEQAVDTYAAIIRAFGDT